MKRLKKLGMKPQKEELEESADAGEIQKNNTRRDSMDYNMYKNGRVIKKERLQSVIKHIYDAETKHLESMLWVLLQRKNHKHLNKVAIKHIIL